MKQRDLQNQRKKDKDLPSIIVSPVLPITQSIQITTSSSSSFLCFLTVRPAVAVVGTTDPDRSVLD
jgi:hypothetical protein